MSGRVRCGLCGRSMSVMDNGAGWLGYRCLHRGTGCDLPRFSNTGLLAATAGSGIGVSTTAGNVTISNTGVLSVTGTTNQVTAAPTSGAVVLSLPQNIHTGASPTFVGATLTGLATGSTATDVVAGQVSMTFASLLSGTPHYKSGRLRGFAVTGAKRAPALPDLPTMQEAGVKGYESSTWYARNLAPREQ